MDSLRDLSHRTVYQSTHRPDGPRRATTGPTGHDGPRRATMGSYSIFYSTLLCTEVSENQPRIRLWHCTATGKYVQSMINHLTGGPPATWGTINMDSRICVRSGGSQSMVGGGNG